MIRPLYNLIAKKPGKTFAAPDAFSSPVMAESEGEEKEDAPGQTGMNKMFVVGAVVITGILAVVMFGSRGKSNNEKNEEEAFIKENARYEMEKKAYDQQRDGLLGEFQSLSSQRNEILQQLKGNFQRAQQNAEDFKEMFSDKKGEHTGGDEGDSINTAFMLKEELEAKKKQMIDEAKNLGLEKQKLMRMIQQNKDNLNHVADTYNSSFDGDPLPRVEEY